MGEALKHTELYQQGYSDGFKEGMSKAIEQYQKLLDNTVTREIRIKCEDFADCPYKKKEAK